MISLVVVFLIALVSDLLACEWQSARERGQLGKIGVLSGAMEAMTWFPIYVAIFTRSIAMVVVSTVGAVVGGVWGAARERKRFPIGKNGSKPDRPGTNAEEYLFGGGCSRPPEGWRCTRGYHVDGPCAAVPDRDDE